MLGSGLLSLSISDVQYPLYCVYLLRLYKDCCARLVFVGQIPLI